jgi:hypothetical protein
MPNLSMSSEAGVTAAGAFATAPCLAAVAMAVRSRTETDFNGNVHEDRVAVKKLDRHHAIRCTAPTVRPPHVHGSALPRHMRGAVRPAPRAVVRCLPEHTRGEHILQVGSQRAEVLGREAHLLLERRRSVTQ